MTTKRLRDGHSIAFGRATTATFNAAKKELKKRGYVYEDCYHAATGSEYIEMSLGDLFVKFRSSNHHYVDYGNAVEISFDDKVYFIEIDLSATGYKIADVRAILDFVENADTSAVKSEEDVNGLCIADEIKKAMIYRLNK